MQLLVSDANVLMDLEYGNLTRYFFILGYIILVPDLLWEQELKGRHSHLLQYGLVLKSLTPTSMEKVEFLNNKYPNPSSFDCAALSLAIQEECPILTGDKALRSAAKLEGVEVHGIIWVVGKLISNNLIDPMQAENSFNSMLSKGSRLPQGEIKKLLEPFRLIKTS